MLVTTTITLRKEDKEYILNHIKPKMIPFSRFLVWCAKEIIAQELAKKEKEVV